MIASADPNTVGTEPPSLFAVLAVRARRTSDGVLAALAAIGGVAAVALAAVRPAWWAFALPLVSAGAFGLWGILERETAERGAVRSARYDRAMGAAQWVAVTIGTVCAIVTVFAVLGILLGRIIS
jgi:fatty acid desaturase